MEIFLWLAGKDKCGPDSHGELDCLPGRGPTAQSSTSCGGKMNKPFVTVFLYSIAPIYYEKSGKPRMLYNKGLQIECTENSN